MKFQAEIDIMLREELLDPQGKTVGNNMKNVGIEGIRDVRIGKHISLLLEAASEKEAGEKVAAACKKLLANVIMETYVFTIKPLD